RAPARAVVTARPAEGVWDVVQLFSDAGEEAEVWGISCQVDLGASAAGARPVFRILSISR
ncbi:MAG TPA: hypothetical protein VHS09_17635, partial [Polyangiaceae bacterium]|nr:hypothetical protein [Polyangiaceae bacterium]